MQRSKSSRFVTKTRWVVESEHDILKEKYRLLDNKILPKVRNYYRIAAFLLNKFRKRMVSDKDITDAIFDRMKQKINDAPKIEQNSCLRKKLPFVRLTSMDLLISRK